MKSMWKDRNLPGDVIDITPDFKYGPYEKKDSCRGDEIQQWINENDISNYVILDDDIDMLENQLSNFVQCSDNPTHPDCIIKTSY